MLIISTFTHSAYLEMALKLLEQQGIGNEHLLVAPLDKHVHDNKQSNFQMVHRNGKSPYDKAFIFATIFMLLGAIYGFVLSWGPIIWATIGIVIGAIIGFLLDFILGNRWSSRESGSEVVVLVKCAAHLTDLVENILWTHQAIGVSKIASYEER